MSKTNSPDQDQAPSVEQIDTQQLIEAFGGIRPMAHKLDIAVSTVQGWRNRNHIPPNRLAEIYDIAEKSDIDLKSLPNEQPETKIEADTNAEPKTSEPVDIDASENNTPEEQPASEPEETHDAPIDKPTKSGSGLAMVVALTSLGAVILSPYWQPILESSFYPKIDAALPSLKRNISQNTGIEALNAVKSITAEVVALSSDVDILRANLAKIEAMDNPTAAPSPRDPSLIEDIIARIEAIEIQTESLDLLQEKLALLATNPPSVAKTSDTLTTTRTNDGMILSALNTHDMRLGKLEKNRTTEIVNIEVDLSSKIADLADLDAKSTKTQDEALKALSEKLTNLKGDLNNLAKRETSAKAAQINPASLAIIAVGQLEAAVLSGNSYLDALNALNALAINNDAMIAQIETLKPNAETGLISRSELARRFTILAPDAEAVARREAAIDWIDLTLENIKSLISIRKKGDNPELSAISRAEAAMERDDIAGAVAALITLAGASENIATWVALAEARLNAESALSALRGNIIKTLQSKISTEGVN